MAGKEILDEAIPVSLNAWLLPAEVLSGFETSFQEFIHLNKKDPDAEFFLPDAVSREMMQGLSIQVSQCKGFWCGLTLPGDLEWVRQFIRQATISGKYPHKWN